MGVYIHKSEFTSDIPVARLFRAFVLDADNLIPKIAPHVVKRTEYHRGHHGQGTFKRITCGDGSTVTHEIHSVVEEHYTHSYSVIEGHGWSDTIEKIHYEIKLERAYHGGTIIKSTSKYHTKGDVKIEEHHEHVQASKVKTSDVLKRIEIYLKNNPYEYN